MKPDLVSVTWQDAASSSAWATEPEVGLTECETVGWLVAKKTDSITIAGERNAADYWGNRTTIPLSCITRVRKLR